MSSTPSASRLEAPIATLKRKRGRPRKNPVPGLEPDPATPRTASVAFPLPSSATPRLQRAATSQTPSPRKAVRKSRLPAGSPVGSDDDYLIEDVESSSLDGAARAQGADEDGDGEFQLDKDGSALVHGVRARRTPSRAASSRPRRARNSLAILLDDDDRIPSTSTDTAQVSSLKKQPKRPYRRNVSRAVSDHENDGDRSPASGAVLGSDSNRKSAELQEPEEEMDEEAKKAAEAKREEEEMVTRWNEEYFEIVEQLPLEIHRSFALIRELESQMQDRIASVSRDAAAYRDARLALHQHLLAKSLPLAPKPSTVAAVEDTATSASTSDGKATVQQSPFIDPPQDPASEQHHPERTQAPTEQTELPTDVLQAAAANKHQPQPPDSVAPTEEEPNAIDSTALAEQSSSALLNREARLSLLHRISHAVCEAVHAGEEKLGLAVNTYDWVDRQIRRLDADLEKSSRNLQLGIRTGTEESRGVREALGLADEDAAAHTATDADASLRKGVGTGEPDGPAPGVAKGPEGSGGRTAMPLLGDEAVLPQGDLATLGEADATPTTRKSARRRSASATPVTRPRRGTTTTSTTNLAPKTAAGTQEDESTATATASASGSTSQTKPKAKQETPPLPTTSIVPGHEAMAIDPNEPRYCYCDQPSFDEMVACDNDDCPREWFHYACVGLGSEPKGKWFCRFCAPPGWKGTGMDVPPNAKFRPSGFKGGGKKRRKRPKNA